MAYSRTGIGRVFFLGGGEEVVNLYTVVFWVLVTAALFFGFFNKVCIFECFIISKDSYCAQPLSNELCLGRKKVFFCFLSVLSGKVFWGSFRSTQLSNLCLYVCQIYPLQSTALESKNMDDLCITNTRENKNHKWHYCCN